MLPFGVVPGPPKNVGVKIESSTLVAKWKWPNLKCADKNGAFLGYHYQLLIGGGEIAVEGVCYYMHWHSPSDNTRLWQLPNVSSAFKGDFFGYL